MTLILFRSHLHGGVRFDDNAMVFYEKYKHILPNYHDNALYVIALVRDVELRRALVDQIFSEYYASINTRGSGDPPRRNNGATDLLI